MKKLFYFLASVFAVSALYSCRPEQDVNNEKRLVFTDVPVNIGQDSDDDGDDTKSLISVEAEKFHKAALFAFDSSKKTIILDDNNKPLAIETTSKSFTWSLPVNKSMNIYVLVNYGNLDLSSYINNKGLTQSSLEGLNFTCSSSAELQKLETEGKGIPMAGIMSDVSVTNNAASVNIKVKKLFAKYNITVNKSALASEGYKISAQYIKASMSNTEVPFFVEGFKQTSDSKLKLIDYGTSSDLTDLSSGKAVTLYFLENCQGNKSGASYWYNAGSLPDINLCSFVELCLNVIDSENQTSARCYRIYLGDDCTTNFDVKRNVVRNINLTIPVEDTHPYNGIVFIDDANTYSKEAGSGSYQSMPLIFETNIPPAKWEYALSPSTSVSGTPSFTDITSGAGYTRSTAYPYAGRLNLNVKTSKSTKVTVGMKENSAWIASDQRTVSVGDDVYTIELSPNPVSVNINDNTQVTASVKKNGAAYSYSGTYSWTSGNSTIMTVSSSSTSPNVSVRGVKVGSTTLTVSVTVNGKAITNSATVEVVNNFNDGFEWEDTQIDIEPGTTQSRTFYCSEKYTDTNKYIKAISDNLKCTIDNDEIFKTPNSSGWQYEGTAIITADYCEGGSTGYIDGQCANKVHRLNATLPLEVSNITIQGRLVFNGQDQELYTAIATLNNGEQISSKDYPSLFTWQVRTQESEEYCTFQKEIPGNLLVSPPFVNGPFGELSCYFHDSSRGLSFTEYFVVEMFMIETEEFTYRYSDAELEMEVEGVFGTQANDWEVKVKILKDYTGASYNNTYEYIYVWDEPVTIGDMTFTATFEWDGHLSTRRIPSSAKVVRAYLYLDGKLKKTMTVNCN